ncbi:TCCD-inducible-PARP-like domain-containing protein [Naegleria gruberi]|uniref:Poly [ADP-ribose] polymerase n=1 Tax=Naegleria gruberi TaxID=5762 RepID=D2VVZ8_NAEGR|nr:TCCD-inducible-PARP-like domain-containing protein [Naegleria gruberi]EFC38991.1 TCCD-inducible-PARP-like domain-containing protein [Naegleria gruberi]|eukprot:XP_002671735.1 TCCD-inducible-PARP-like domain-containing protein [Naegleria gruberi strain NEG-M]
MEDMKNNQIEIQNTQKSNRVSTSNNRNYSKAIHYGVILPEERRIIKEERKIESLSLENEKIRKERKQQHEITNQSFMELCSLNERVSKQRTLLSETIEKVIFQSKELFIHQSIQEGYFIMKGQISTCHNFINENLPNLVLDIGIREHIEHVNSLLYYIGSVVEAINLDSYLINLNSYMQLLEEKLEKLKEFIGNYLNEIYSQNNEAVYVKNTEEIPNYIGNALGKIVSGTNFERNSKIGLELVTKQLQNITFSLISSVGISNTELSSSLGNAMENLEQERKYLDDISANFKNLIPKEIQITIFHLFHDYYIQYSTCEMFIQDRIPFIIEKFEELQSQVEVMNNYPQLSSQLTNLLIRKTTLRSKMNTLDIEGIKSALEIAKKGNMPEMEILKFENKLRKKESQVPKYQEEWRNIYEQLRELKTKFIQLEGLGFKIDLLSDPSFDEIEENDLFEPLNERKLQDQVKFIENQSKQLKEYEQQLNNLKLNMTNEHAELEQKIKELEQKKKQLSRESSKEREELSKQVERLKRKEKKLEKMEKEMIENKSKQLNIGLPRYWKRNSFNRFADRYNTVDVTSQLKDIIQEIMNVSSNSKTLGSGRDQLYKMKYSKLVISSVYRIENPSLYSAYKIRENHISSYQDPLNPIQVQTENFTTLKSPAFEWLKSTGLNTSMNEKYLWHGTKHEYVNTISEHGFDERVASLAGLFGAGVYFAEYCSKSDQYSTPDTNGEYYMFLCRVVLGRQIYYTPMGMTNQRRPPEINGSNRRVYDSVIGQSNSSNSSYREFIVYDRYQCYPEYLIKYRRE